MWCVGGPRTTPALVSSSAAHAPSGAHGPRFRSGHHPHDESGCIFLHVVRPAGSFSKCHTSLA